MPPKISILIPVYNVEPYLQRCIDSVLVQDFQDWEMILVDDGSPDRCPEICDAAAKKDERITVVHKENGGLLSARKAGVHIAKGEFLVFWDSDDTVPKNALSILYNHIKKGYDVVRGSGLRVTNDGKQSPLEPYSFIGEINTTDDYLRKQFMGEIAPYLWNGIYKASLFDDAIYDTSIAYRVSVGEDWVTNLIVGLRVKNALITDDIVYHYYYNPMSYMGSSVYALSYQDRVDQALTETGVLKHPAIAPLVAGKHCCGLIRSFFVPELGFSLAVYNEVRKFSKDKNQFSNVKRKMSKKFVRFVDNLPLFYLYSRVYCLLFKYIKMKGHSRKVIR